jgi:hypothetical protein
MQTTIENQIMSQLRGMNQEEKTELLNYLKMRSPKRHSNKIYKKRALRQIRKALEVDV